MERHFLQAGSLCRIYLLEDGGHCPAAEFLTEVAQAHENEFEKLQDLLDYASDHGPPRNKQKCRSLGDGLFEFKTGGGLRLFWFWDHGHLILCTHGFVKKTRKTPRKERDLALGWKKRYEASRDAGRLKSFDD
ncbi:MAG: type II toxin-antitoxin system RelE/ParE family toxin [Verrucomicrobiae bacterium]|nr:type II toxin-antitoxin system RelE/ParE family toxin [Verrucomicrobiae bacterium]MCP5550549.1 type II toxin-antitoxin system RelE/ParE family toxin [Akkermansiaceae bacterium]